MSYPDISKVEKYIVYKGKAKLSNIFFGKVPLAKPTFSKKGKSLELFPMTNIIYRISIQLLMSALHYQNSEFSCVMCYVLSYS